MVNNDKLNMFDMFGFNIHRWTRFLAGFVFGPYLVYHGHLLNDHILFIFGLGSIFFDIVTLYYTYNEPSNDLCIPLQIGIIIGFIIMGYLICLVKLKFQQKLNEEKDDSN